MTPKGGVAPSSSPGARGTSQGSQPLFFINFVDAKDKKRIGRYAQLATHRKKRAKRIANVAPSKDGILATGPLAWRKKDDSPPHSDTDEESLVSLSPKTVLGAGRTDPFSCYPIAPSPEVDALVDHLATTIGPQMCGYRPNPHFEFMRDRSLKLAMKDPAGFHTVLSMAQTHLDAMNGMRPGPRALSHRVEAIRLVNRYLSDPILSTSDRTIFAVAMLMAQERIWSPEAAVESIGKGLDAILQQRGGLATLKNSSKLEFALYTIVLSAPVLSPHGALALYGMSDMQATKEQVSSALTGEFVTFVESVRYVALGPNSPHEYLPFAFKPGTPAHRLLAAPPTPRFGWVGGWIMQERARLATLLHIHCMILDMRTSPDRLARYSKHFALIQRRENIWAQSLEMLHHLVAKHETEVRLDDSERSWKVLRIVNTAFRLSRPSYHTFRSFLFRYLSDETSTEEWQLCLDWDPEHIREELFQEFSRM